MCEHVCDCLVKFNKEFLFLIVIRVESVVVSMKYFSGNDGVNMFVVDYRSLSLWKSFVFFLLIVKD